MANLSANAGASASDAGPPSQLAKSKAVLDSDVRKIVTAAGDTQEVFMEAFPDNVSECLCAMLR